jgi:hypothetical protein
MFLCNVCLDLRELVIKREELFDEIRWTQKCRMYVCKWKADRGCDIDHRSTKDENRSYLELPLT